MSDLKYTKSLQWSEVELASRSGETSKNGHFLIEKNITENFNLYEWNQNQKLHT